MPGREREINVDSDWSVDFGFNAEIGTRWFLSDSFFLGAEAAYHLILLNDGTSEVQLQELTVRYWYTREPTSPETVFIDYCKRCVGLNGKTTVETQRSFADHYVEISWPSGGVIPITGGRDEQLSLRIDTTDDSRINNYNQTNAWSFDGTKTAKADWTHVTVYRNGALIWGQEPPPL